MCASLYIIPLVFPLAADRGKPLADRYITKANLWIAVFSFIGNYWRDSCHTTTTARPSTL